jgi:hypothetical protein
MYMCIYHSICDHHIHATLAAGPISVRGIVIYVYVYVNLYMYMSLQLVQCVRSLLCHCEYSVYVRFLLYKTMKSYRDKYG